MTNQDKKQFLSLYRVNELEIARLSDEITRWESKAYKVTTSFGNISGGSGDDRIQVCIEQIDELRLQLASQVRERIRLRGDIISAINSITDPCLRQLMRYRYIDGANWEQISELLHYDPDGRNVHKLHLKALSLITPDTDLHSIPMV